MGAVGRFRRSGDGSIVLAVAGLMLALFLVAPDRTIVPDEPRGEGAVSDASPIPRLSERIESRNGGHPDLIHAAALADERYGDERAVHVSKTVVRPLARPGSAANGAGETG